MKLTIDVGSKDEAYLRALARLHGWERAEDAVRYLVSSAIDGLVRPGSWERGWISQAFPMDRELWGDDADEDLQLEASQHE